MKRNSYYSFSDEDRSKSVSQYKLAPKRIEFSALEAAAGYYYKQKLARYSRGRAKYHDPDVWCGIVDEMKIDFTREYHFLDKLEAGEGAFAEYTGLVSKLIAAVKDYLEHVKEVSQPVSISAESTKNYFYLLPVLLRRTHEVSIDADTGFVSIAFAARDEGLMSALITGKGDIHYSYVSRGTKIVKISGTAKFKHSRDLGKFERVLRIL